MTLPAKLKRPRLQINAPERVFPRHRKWLRSHECVVTLSDCNVACSSVIEVSHIRTAANSGTGLKPPDWSAVPMCSLHHRNYHDFGHETWQRTYGLDLAKLAAEFAARSPDQKMRLAMKEALHA